MKIGANYTYGQKCGFTVWAPFAQDIFLKLPSTPERSLPMQKDERGYWNTAADDVLPGTMYLYIINGKKERPDPASFFQPNGVHKASQVVDHGAFHWHDSGWKGLPISDMIIYELHVGVFTCGGTFGDIVPFLDELKDVGINTIELMPVAQFPGERNWGYDGVYPFAVQNSYGGPDGLKHLVNECHKKGIAVVLDVVYNHAGPEGNYLRDYGPYFTDRYKTPWGQAINFDGPHSNEVRNYFIENALYWFDVFHIDGLRLDAIHGIYDMSSRHILFELAEKADEYSKSKGRKVYLMAESDLNDSNVIRAKEEGGHGIDSLWCDDFHHALHTLVTGETGGYYADFGRMEHMAGALKEGFVYSGQYSKYRKRNHGNSSRDLPAGKFIVFSQNHDQTGNRMKGERLSTLVSFESLKLAAGMVILSPYVPLLFMGEEYGETAPFLFFANHSDPDLIRGVREGRKAEFKSFGWQEEPPDPQDLKIFKESGISWNIRREGGHKVLLEFYKELIRLRKKIPSLSNLDKDCLDVRYEEEKKTIFIRRWKDGDQILIFYNFNKSDIEVNLINYENKWKKVLDSSDSGWNGPGTLLPDIIVNEKEMVMRAESFALYIKER